MRSVTRYRAAVLWAGVAAVAAAAPAVAQAPLYPAPPPPSAAPVPPASPEAAEIAACLCLGQAVAALSAEMTAKQRSYDSVQDELTRLDAQLKESHRRIRVAVKASGTSLTDLYGVGPIIAAQIIGYSGDIHRFANRDAYASYNGTAPVEFASGGRVVHRVSLRGCRKLNHALHMAPISQIRQTGSDGRVYFERKVAEGKTKKESIRSLKRHISNAVYRQLLLDAR